MSDKRIFRFDGEKLDVLWDSRLCIHVGECTRAREELFVSGRKPWCEPDRGDADNVAEVVQRCPTGALVYERKDGGAGEAAQATNEVSVANNGPLYFSGDLQIDGAAHDMPGVRLRAALCRCGESDNKPFCDNSHEAAEFLDRGALGQTGEATLESIGGALVIKRIQNGPLIVTGSFSMRAASGREAWRGTRAALCRCGASKNKPFCDGTHKEVGFEAD
jgi:CDGSH-type Zn-finger protein/uncharacterized Fe-S cluster protein YjdI